MLGLRLGQRERVHPVYQRRLGIVSGVAVFGTQGIRVIVIRLRSECVLAAIDQVCQKVRELVVASEDLINILVELGRRNHSILYSAE